MLQTVSAPQAIVDFITENIRNGRFKAGEKLPSERKLMKELETGRLALREAMARLTALGIVHVHHGKGAFVRETVKPSALADVLLPMTVAGDTDKLTDLLEARTLIEEGMAARASEVGSEEEVKHLEAILKAGMDHTEDPGALADMDFAFHREIGRIAGNSFLCSLHDAMAEHVRTFLEQYTTEHKDGAEVVKRHRKILRAIKKGDAEAARTAAREHIRLCRSSLKREKTDNR